MCCYVASSVGSTTEGAVIKDGVSGFPAGGRAVPRDPLDNGSTWALHLLPKKTVGRPSSRYVALNGRRKFGGKIKDNGATKWSERLAHRKEALGLTPGLWASMCICLYVVVCSPCVCIGFTQNTPNIFRSAEDSATVKCVIRLQFEQSKALKKTWCQFWSCCNDHMIKGRTLLRKSSCLSHC